MRNRILLVCVVAIAVIALVPISIVYEDRPFADRHEAIRGLLDLRDWDDAKQERIELGGEWEFYWGRLLTPEDFRESGTGLPAPDAYMDVPSQWAGKTVNGTVLPDKGSATYRLTLTNLPHDGIYAIKKQNVRFASAIFVNGEKLFQDGRPARDESGYVPGNVPQFGSFPHDGGNVEIIVQVSNYDYISGGIPAALYFGVQEPMLKTEQGNTAREFTILAILGTLSFIFFLWFMTSAWYRSVDYSLLAFALLCFMFALYNGLIGERALLLALPDVSFAAMYKVKDITAIASFMILAVFFHKYHRDIINLRFTQFVCLALGSFVVLTVCVPISVYTPFVTPVILLYESLILWLAARLGIMFVKRDDVDRTMFYLLFLAMLCINLYSLDLILFAVSVKEDLRLGQTAIILFTLILIFSAVVRFFQGYRSQVEMKDQLLRSDRIKDDFLSNTSHELKTPLNAIVNITNALRQGAAGAVNEEQAQNLAIVAESGKRLTHLVNELLDYSRMKHGDVELRRGLVDLKATADAVLKMHSYLLGNKPVSLKNAIPDDAPAVYADGNRLIQILHNLIGNAVKFTDQGRVEIGAAVSANGMMEVRVTDTGIGIAPSMHKRVFEAFEQGEGHENRRYEGTGLGLSITKRLVELHGGSIEVDSTPGVGSAFRFTLPAARSSELPDPAPVFASPQRLTPSAVEAANPIFFGEKAAGRILVVDDDPANLQAMVNLLRLDGYAGAAVNQGRLALELLSQDADFLMVITDVMMPDLSGYELLRLIRERYTPHELPVLMLTAGNRPGDVKTSVELGANDFVRKPFEADELMARVRSLARLKVSVEEAKDAEIAFLRSQIKPHFLYNALNSIASLCMDEPRRAEELTLELSQYLRSSFDFKALDSFTTVENELKLVRAYVSIEQARFGERLQVEYELDAAPGFRIPPLMLQPLVENAIRHGAMSRNAGGKVRVSVSRIGNGMHRFAVEDDGPGMDADQLRILRNPDHANTRGVGLWNINRRIKLLYGTSIRIDSRAGVGTTITIDIPAQTAIGSRGAAHAGIGR